MSNILSLFGSSSGNDSPLPGLDAARNLIAQVSGDDSSDFISLLRKALKKHPDIAAALAWLYAHERRHADDTTAMVLLAALLDGPMFTSAQRRRSAKAAADELEKALRDRGVPDDIKITILPLLDLAGQPVDDDSARGFFQDFEAAARRQSLDLAKNLSDSPVSLTKLLLAQGFLVDEEGATHEPVTVELATGLMTLGHNIAEFNPAGATLMTAALIFRVGAPDFSHERSPAQLDEIHRLATPRARWCLETLANWPGFAMPFRHKAARLAGELAGRGIKNEAPLVPGEFARAFVSMTDGMGSRAAALFQQTPNGGLDAVNVMLNDEVGVKDVFAFFGNGKDMERMLRESPEQLSLGKATVSLVRELLADSLALHEDLGTAPPGALFPLMAYFGDEAVTPRKREPNLGAYRLETLKPTPDLVSGGTELAESPLFGSLFPASDAAYAFCDKHWDKQRKSIKASDFPAFLKEIMPLERERLLRRMAVNLEVEALAGHAGHKDNQKAARLWLGMKENVVPFWTVPFVQELADIGVTAIAEDLQNGFKNQRDAALAEEGMTKKALDEALGFPLSELELESLSEEEQEGMLGTMLHKLFGDVDMSGALPPDLLADAPGSHKKPRKKPKRKK